MEHQIIVIEDPLLHRIEYISESFKSYHLHPKYSRITASSDCSLNIEILWSHNNESNEGCKSSFRVPKGLHRNEKFEVMDRFFKIRILKGEGDTSINKELRIEVFPLKDCKREKRVSMSKVSEEPFDLSKFEDHSKFEDQSKRSSSPFRSKIFDKKKHVIPNKSSSLPVDYRLPEFIGRNCLLIGDKCGKIKSIPLGIPGEFLMVTDSNTVEWLLPYPPRLN